MPASPPRPTTTLVVAGPAGVGKTTVMRALVERLGWTWLEGDDRHPAANVAKMRDGIPLTDADRAPWLAGIATWIGQQEADGRDAVVTCSALRRRYRDVLSAGHPSVWFAQLEAPRAELADRMAMRAGHYMPASLLESQLDAFEPLGPDEPGAILDASLPVPRLVDAIIAGRDAA